MAKVTHIKRLTADPLAALTRFLAPYSDTR